MRSGDNHIPPPPHYVYIPTPPDQRLHNTPTPEIYSVLHPSPFHFISHSITFSYTLSTISITTSYSMVGVRWCATLLRGEFVNISSITMLLFFTCIVFPTIPIVSLSSSINVLSIYSHSLSIVVGWSVLVSILSLPTPFHLFPVSYPLPCRVPFPGIPVKFLTWCYILVLKVKLQLIVLPLFSGYRFIFYKL